MQQIHAQWQFTGSCRYRLMVDFIKAANQQWKLVTCRLVLKTSSVWACVCVCVRACVCHNVTIQLLDHHWKTSTWYVHLFQSNFSIIHQPMSVTHQSWKPRLTVSLGPDQVTNMHSAMIITEYNRTVAQYSLHFCRCNNTHQITPHRHIVLSLCNYFYSSRAMFLT